MRNRMRYMPLAVALLLGAGCDSLFDLDINTDPDAATEVPGDLLLTNTLVSIGSTRAIEIQPGHAEFVNIMTANGSASVFINPERYDISSFTNGNTWSTWFLDGLKHMTLMRQQALASDPERSNVAAQAEIVMAYLFLTGSLIWERIPFTQALDGAQFPTPEFDDQETVLRGVVDMLDTAVGRIDEDGLEGVGFGDLVYEGDMELWRRLGNSLKLRTLMLIRNKDASVDAQISAVLAQPLIRTNAQEAAIPFFATAGNENPVWKLNNLFGGFTNAGNGNGFIFAGKVAVDLMKDLGDPRLDTYFEHAVVDFDISPDGGGPATTEHFGQRAGVSNYDDAMTSMISQNIIRRDWPNRMVTAAEVWLFEAEFHALQGNLAAAHSSYITGVQVGLDYFDGKPGSISSAAKQAYINSLPGSFSGQEPALEAIWAQQYVEVFDRAPENWTHWRRTKFPTLPLAEQAVLGDIIRRFAIPTDEVSANPNAPTGIPLDQPMWFEK